MPDVSSFLLVGFLLIGNSIWWFYVVIRPVRGYTNLSFPYASASYQEKPRGGYVSHTVVIRLMSWLYVVIYCKCTEKESEPRNDTQGRPPIIMTSATSRKYSIRWFYVVIRSQPVVIHSSPWLYQSFFSRCVIILPGKPRGGYVSYTVVIRLISWLCVVIRGYILHMYPKGAITFRRWFYVVIRSKPWLYDPVRSYTAFFSPEASASYQESPHVVMCP